MNLWTPVSTTSSSSLGAVAWRRRTLQDENRGNQDTVGMICVFYDLEDGISEDQTNFPFMHVHTLHFSRDFDPINLFNTT